MIIVLILSFRDMELTGDAHARKVVIEAAESMVDRFSEGVSQLQSVTIKCYLYADLDIGRLYTLVGRDE
jgi:hypothetical protein